MCPPNVQQCVQQLKTFSPPALQVDDEPTLPTPLEPRTPTKPMACEVQLNRWEQKFMENGSSPSRQEWCGWLKVVNKYLLSRKFKTTNYKYFNRGGWKRIRGR